jgi:hypothetical protein
VIRVWFYVESITSIRKNRPIFGAKPPPFGYRRTLVCALGGPQNFSILQRRKKAATLHEYCCEHQQRDSFRKKKFSLNSKNKSGDLISVNPHKP